MSFGPRSRGDCKGHQKEVREQLADRDAEASGAPWSWHAYGQAVTEAVSVRGPGFSARLPRGLAAVPGLRTETLSFSNA